MSDITYVGGKPAIRRDDWKHTVASPRTNTARKVPATFFKEKKVDYDFTPAIKPEIHPSKLPPSMAPAQVDWKGGREYYDRKQGNVRNVTTAEVPELVLWGIEKIRSRYPRVDAQAITAFLTVCCRGGTRRFLRTDNGCALFEMKQTAWEPLPVVEDVFVIVREPQFAALDARRLYSAGRTWAEEIGAVEFRFHSDTGLDITPIARRVGYDYRGYSFAKRLKE